jgi:hypothetical protein
MNPFTVPLDRKNKLFWKMEVIQVAVRKYLLHVWFKDLVNLETMGYDDQALHLQKCRNIRKCKLMVLAQLWIRKNVWGYFMGSQFPIIYSYLKIIFV